MPTDEQIRSAVLDLVAQVPLGRVTTYGALARMLKINPRQIGRVLHSNTNPLKYPCHRVVHHDGATAAAYVFGGSGKQQLLLKNEGVVFTGKRVVLASHFFNDFH